LSPLENLLAIGTDARCAHLSVGSSGLNNMTMTVRGLKALGRVVRLQTAVEMQLPVEMQLALLSLAVGEGELGAERPGLQAALEMTEHAHDHASIPQKARSGR
jgi:hypothetical protein